MQTIDDFISILENIKKTLTNGDTPIHFAFSGKDDYGRDFFECFELEGYTLVQDQDGNSNKNQIVLNLDVPDIGGKSQHLRLIDNEN